MTDHADAESPQPWEQMGGEGDKAFAAFIVFKEMGRAQRSLPATSRAVYGADTGGERGVVGRITEWASLWSWRDRARAWDHHLDRLKDDATRNEIEAMGRRQAQQAQAYQQAMVQPTLAVLRRLALPAEHPKSLVRDLEVMSGPQLLTLAADTGSVWQSMVKIERLARGASTENVDQHVQHSGGISASGGPASPNQSTDDGHFAEVLAILIETGIIAPGPTLTVDAEADPVHPASAISQANSLPVIDV